MVRRRKETKRKKKNRFENSGRKEGKERESIRLDLFPRSKDSEEWRGGEKWRKTKGEKETKGSEGEKTGKMEKSGERKEKEGGEEGREGRKEVKGEGEKGAWRVCIFFFSVFFFSSI